MDQWLLGAVLVTALQFKTSSGMFSKLRRQVAHSLPSWLTDRWFAGGIQVMAVTAAQSNTN
jgi:hypothetical protein